MCTGFERSAYSVIKNFSISEAKTIKELRSVLGEERFILFLGGGKSLSQFIRALAFDGFLEFCEPNAYILTDKGQDKLSELEAKQVA